VSYELVVQPEGSAEHAQRHLLPYHTDHHVFAFVSNTFMGITLDRTPLAGDVTIRVDAAPDQQVFTGWQGFSVGPQVGGASGSFPGGNGIFAMGKSFGHFTTDVGGTVLEVAQFASGPDATRGVAEDARTAIASFARGIGGGPRGPVRLFIEGSRGGGTHTDFGVVIDLPDTVPLPDDMKLLLAHELFHDWLGSSLVDQRAGRLVQRGGRDLSGRSP
jgi:hypothetical protein